MSAYTDIEVEIRDPVALIRLNRPDKLNAFTYHTLSELRGAGQSTHPRAWGAFVAAGDWR